MRFVLPFSVFVVLGLLYGCEKDSEPEPALFSATEHGVVVSKYNTNKPSKSVVEVIEYYDNDGYLYKSTVSNSEYSYPKHYSYTYDDDRNLVEYKDDDDNTSLTRYSYRNGLKTIVGFDDRYFKYTYTDGIITAIDRYDDAEGLVESKYYLNDGLVDSLMVRNLNSEIFRLIMMYDENKNIISRKFLAIGYFKGILFSDISENKYYYDENNLLVRMQYTEGDSDICMHFDNHGYELFCQSFYSYDERNNLKRIEHYTNNQPDYFYEYNYYNCDSLELHRVDFSKLNPPEISRYGLVVN